MHHDPGSLTRIGAQLANHEQHARNYRLLELFAYGTWADYDGEPDQYGDSRNLYSRVTSAPQVHATSSRR